MSVSVCVWGVYLCDAKDGTQGLVCVGQASSAPSNPNSNLSFCTKGF